MAELVKRDAVHLGNPISGRRVMERSVIDEPFMCGVERQIRLLKEAIAGPQRSRVTELRSEPLYGEMRWEK
jgi:hypothetical protein